MLLTSIKARSSSSQPRTAPSTFLPDPSWRMSWFKVLFAFLSIRALVLCSKIGLFLMSKVVGMNCDIEDYGITENIAVKQE